MGWGLFLHFSVIIFTGLNFFGVQGYGQRKDYRKASERDTRAFLLTCLVFHFDLSVCKLHSMHDSCTYGYTAQAARKSRAARYLFVSTAQAYSQAA